MPEGRLPSTAASPAAAFVTAAGVPVAGVLFLSAAVDGPPCCAIAAVTPATAPPVKKERDMRGARGRDSSWASSAFRWATAARCGVGVDSVLCVKMRRLARDACIQIRGC